MLHAKCVKGLSPVYSTYKKALKSTKEQCPGDMTEKTTRALVVGITGAGKPE